MFVLLSEFNSNVSPHKQGQINTVVTLDISQSMPSTVVLETISLTEELFTALSNHNTVSGYVGNVAVKFLLYFF